MEVSCVSLGMHRHAFEPPSPPPTYTSPSPLVPPLITHTHVRVGAGGRVDVLRHRDALDDAFFVVGDVLVFLPLGADLVGGPSDERVVEVRGLCVVG